MAYTSKILRAEIVFRPNTAYQLEISTTPAQETFILPMTVEVNVGGFPAFDRANIRIYGMNPRELQLISFLWWINTTAMQKNSIAIYDSSDFDNYTNPPIFAGDIIRATPMYTEVPDVYVEIEAVAGIYFAKQLTAPVSIGSTSTTVQGIIDTFIGQIREKNPTIPENEFPILQASPDAKSIIVKNKAFSGTFQTKLQSVCHMLKLNDDVTLQYNGKDILFYNTRSPGVFRNTFTVSSYVERANPSTRAYVLYGYPRFTQFGVEIDCDFIKDLKVYDFIELESNIPIASGTYQVVTFSHLLESQLSDSGEWMTHINMIRYTPPAQTNANV